MWAAIVSLVAMVAYATVGESDGMTLACDGWEARARDGDPIAQVALADCYLQGNGRQVDLGKAEKWLRLAVRQGDPRAMNDLASLFLFRKENATVDEKRKAIELLNSAADAYEWAHFPLGLAYWSGLGTEQDAARAVEHFRLAADSNHLLATFALSCIYTAGLRGIEADAALATSLQKAVRVRMNRGGFPTLGEMAESVMADPFVRRYLFTDQEVEQLHSCSVSE